MSRQLPQLQLLRMPYVFSLHTPLCRSSSRFWNSRAKQRCPIKNHAISLYVGFSGRYHSTASAMLRQRISIRITLRCADACLALLRRSSVGLARRRKCRRGCCLWNDGGWPTDDLGLFPCGAGQFLVALVFGELVSTMPISGGLCTGSRRWSRCFGLGTGMPSGMSPSRPPLPPSPS